MWLMLACQRQGFTSGFWGTRADWELLDGKIKDGPGTQVVGSGGQQLDTVWNLGQIGGDFPVSFNQRPPVDYALVDRIITGTKGAIRFTDEPLAEYHYPQPGGGGDFILIWRKEHFERGPGGVPFFYNVLFHELAHFSEVRLGWYGPPEVKELRSEIAADFLTTELAIPSYPYQLRKNVHQHLGVWVKRMRDDPELIFKVARTAAEAVDYILGCTLPAEPPHREVGDEAA
jgi:antirestriction protein ArdC